MLCVLQKKNQSLLLLVSEEQVSLHWPAWSKLCISYYTLFRNVSAGDGGMNIRFKVPAALQGKRNTITIRPRSFSLTRLGGQESRSICTMVPTLCSEISESLFALPVGALI